MYVPFVGLGLYGGWRGNRWLRNRIKIFKQFVIPSLLNQTNRNFTIWISFIPELKNNPLVNDLGLYLNALGLDHVFTYSGVCFYDDKYPPEQARKRLMEALHDSLPTLINKIGEVDLVYMTIQPSDDCYRKNTVALIQDFFAKGTLSQAIGFKHGYIMDYKAKSLAEYNPNTNPPFYTIRFPKAIFVDPFKHLEYTSIKNDGQPKISAGKYEPGTPLPSHEYVGDCFLYTQYEYRAFLVGTHGENISTIFNHPFKGRLIEGQDEYFGLLNEFGLLRVEPLKIKISLRKRLLRLLPPNIQRKLRYIFGEKFWNRIYEYLRS